MRHLAPKPLHALLLLAATLFITPTPLMASNTPSTADCDPANDPYGCDCYTDLENLGACHIINQNSIESWEDPLQVSGFFNTYQDHNDIYIVELFTEDLPGKGLIKVLENGGIWQTKNDVLEYVSHLLSVPRDIDGNLEPFIFIQHGKTIPVSLNYEFFPALYPLLNKNIIDILLRHPLTEDIIIIDDDNPNGLSDQTIQCIQNSWLATNLLRSDYSQDTVDITDSYHEINVGIAKTSSHVTISSDENPTNPPPVNVPTEYFSTGSTSVDLTLVTEPDTPSNYLNCTFDGSQCWFTDITEKITGEPVPTFRLIRIHADTIILTQDHYSCGYPSHIYPGSTITSHNVSSLEIRSCIRSGILGQSIFDQVHGYAQVYVGGGLATLNTTAIDPITAMETAAGLCL